MRLSRRSFATCDRKRRTCSQVIERRRAALIERFFGKLFIEGQRAGMVRKDVPAKLTIEILLAHRPGNHESIEDGGVRHDAERGVRRNSQNYPRRRADPTGPHHRLIESLAALMRLMRKSFAPKSDVLGLSPRSQCRSSFARVITRKNAVSGTIEVDEAHVGPRIERTRRENFRVGR